MTSFLGADKLTFSKGRVEAEFVRACLVEHFQMKSFVQKYR